MNLNHNRYTSYGNTGYGYGYSYRRRRTPWGRILLLFLLMGVAGYLSYRYWWGKPEVPIPLVNTALPEATPTRAALSLVAEADDLYWAGKFDAAIAAYQQALSLEPDNGAYYEALARLLIFQGRPERGLDMAREALRINPESARAWAMLGMAYDWLYLPEEAIPAIEKALSLDQTSPELYAYLAEAQIDTGNWYDANNTIETALKLDGNNLDVLRDQAYVLENQGRYTEAIENYRKALTLHPYFADLYLSIARNAQGMGDYSLALQTLQEGVEVMTDSATIHDMLGYNQLLQGQPEEAATHLNRAVELEPNNWRAKGHLATLEFQDRNYEDAIPAFRQSIQYGEAERRRRTVYLIFTAEPTDAVPAAPNGPEIARGTFVHPASLESPLRAVITGTTDYSTLRGIARLDVMNGRYLIHLEGLPQPPAGTTYIGWFVPLQSPERTTVRTPPIAPAPDGRVNLDEYTGVVKGPPIEHYYTLALTYYFLDQCDQAQPYIQAALRLGPEDTNALQAQNLCAAP